MYIPLYVKSNYSLLSSVLKIDDIINYAASNNIPSCVINDTSMYGVMEFIKKCEKNNIKPIISIAVQLNNKEKVLFAKTYLGYKSLIKLSTINSERKLTYEDLQKYNEDLLIVIPYKSIKDEDDTYNKLSTIYNDIYIGYSTLKEERLSRLISQQVVFFKESLYLNKTDSDILKYLYLIRDSKNIHDEVDYDIINHELIFDNIESLSSTEGLSKTFEIADKYNVVFPKPELLLPIYKDTMNMTPSNYLFELAKKGLSKRLDGNIKEEYKKDYLMN